MSDLKWLSASDGPECLPDPNSALAEPNGLLAAGGSLSRRPLLTICDPDHSRGGFLAPNVSSRVYQRLGGVVSHLRQPANVRGHVQTRPQRKR